jgi:hypothetical protein
MNTINRWTRRRSEGRCARCAQPAVTFIPVAGADHVCTTHALEFWHGLLAYTRHRQLETNLESARRLPERRVLVPHRPPPGDLTCSTA